MSESGSNRSTWWLFAALAFAFVPVLIVSLVEVWKHAHYRYVPVLLIYIGVLLRRGVKVREWPPQRFLRLRHVVLAIALVLLTGFALGSSAWLGGLAFVFGAGATILVAQRTFEIRNGFGIWLLTWLVAPLAVWDEGVSALLNRLSARGAGAFLETVRVDNWIDGNTIRLAENQWAVGEVFSGLLALPAVLAIALAVCAWRDRPLFHTFVMGAASVVVTGALIILRVVVPAIAVGRFDTSVPLWAVDCLLAVFAFPLMLSMDRLMEGLLLPIDSDGRGTASNPFNVTWNTIVTFGYPQVSAPMAPPRNSDQPAEGERVWTVWTVAFGVAGSLSLALLLMRGIVDKPSPQGADVVTTSHSHSTTTEAGAVE